MHRLLKLSGTPLHNYPRSSLGSFRINADIKNSEKTCLLCKHINNISRSQVRTQTTNTNPNLHVKRPKKKAKTKTYAELVIVTENSSKQRKANIRKLTSSDLNLLVKTNLNLSELYKLKEILKNPTVFEEHSYNNLNVIDSVPSSSGTQSDFIESETVTDGTDEKVLICEIPSLVPPAKENKLLEEEGEELAIQEEEEVREIGLDHQGAVISTFQPDIIDEPISHHVEPKDIEKKGKFDFDPKYKEEINDKTLNSFIEVCVHLKNPQRGLSALNYYRGRINHRFYTPVKNVSVYNACLKGFAHKGDFSKLTEVLKIMEQEKIALNVQSYVAIFECLGRLNVKDSHLKEIRIYGKEALSNGITFDKMMNEGIFLNDQRKMVMKAFESYDPNFFPNYKKPVVWYNNHLVNHLNCKEQMKSKTRKYKQNGGIFSPRMLKNRIQKQIEIERAGQVTVKSIDPKGPISEEVLRHRQTLEDHYKMWEEEAYKAFNRDILTLAAQRSAFNMEPYLRCIPTRDFVAIILNEAKKMSQGSETYSPTVNMLYRALGSRVYARYLVLRKTKTGVLDKMTDIHERYCSQYATLHTKLDVVPSQELKTNPRQMWQWTEHSFIHKGSTLAMDHQEWVPTTLTFIGKFLYHIVMHDLKIDVNSLRNSSHKNYLPAFYTIFRTQGRLVNEEVKPHPILSKLYRYSMPETLTFPPWELPMLCPPVPWTSKDNGGYILSPCDVVRLPSLATSQKQRMAEAGSQQLYPSLDALNQLGAVPWKVNRKILDVILEVFKNGGSSSLDVPQPPTSLTPPALVSNEMDKAERYNLFRQRLQYRRKKAEMYSLWCDCLYRLSLANHFRDDIFWLPHNMDFRGRVYPIPPHLNHLGSDLARSMLVFAEARPLGEKGLEWLLIHLINLTGLKKRDPISERLKFANEKMDLILDSADNPLNGSKWWAESDEPWQTLACCMEIADVVRSPSIENYRSHFPIHQDGSCNGLQHYAALGRDSSGAYSVNLTPSYEPQDVYSAVVALVEEQREKDAQEGNEIAKILEGFVKRKVIKQTIMTTVYGVTRFGARLQIARQLKDINNFPKDSVWPASSYLTTRTFESLKTMFTSTREIQDWFTECARLISSVGCQQVEWVTPLGLPIVQPYFKAKKTVRDSFTIEKFEKPNVMKQKNAFPPNFIHSLDSSHMMLTSLQCEWAGITYVSVHDCYWTHPSTVHIMNKICREQFVALHSEPILENLSNFLAEKYSYNLLFEGNTTDQTKRKLNKVLTQLPKTGDFDIKQVLDSVYFFS